MSLADLRPSLQAPGKEGYLVTNVFTPTKMDASCYLQ